MDDRRLSPGTVAVVAGRGAGAAGDPLNVPVTFASMYRAGGATSYSREGNPTWTALEETLGALEGGTALAFSSGIAAVSAVLEELPLGAVVVCPADAYLGTRAYLAEAEGKGRVRTRLVDVGDTDATLAATEGADLLWVESPTNPLLTVADLPALCAGAHALGVPVCVDNTLATPLGQRPLHLGADVVVHSVTKFLAGHSDVLLGAVVTADPARAEALHRRRTLLGSVPGPMEAYLALRGIRTLGVRLERAQENAGELARRLAAHPAVARVRYPGLSTDPGHARAATFMQGFGAMVSVELHDGEAAADAVCAGVRLLVSATSLGGVETTLERRHQWPGEEAIPPALLRISVGVEDVEDLWRDLAHALDLARRAVAGPAGAVGPPA
jgi:cystathionine gamma-synthase